DPAYGAVGLKMMQDALRRQPLQFGLGLGQYGAMTKMLAAMRWDVWPVPFYFRVLKGRRFCEEFQALRTTATRKRFMNFAAATGLAGAGASLADSLARWRRPAAAHAERINRFSAWADEIWDQARGAYSVLEWRDSNVLNELYSANPSLECLKITSSALTTCS